MDGEVFVGALAHIHSTGNGLLKISDDYLKKIIRTDPISDVYHVEQTPFARGKFATVRKARHLQTGIEYAAKFIRKRRRAQDTSHEISHEVAVLLQCSQSPRVVKLHEVFDTRTEVALILELAAGGELQAILDTEECLPESIAQRTLKQILEGLRHLHERNVAHLDLKPQNLLLTNDKLLPATTTTANENHFQHSDIKLCDFGISRVIEHGVEVREILGTPDYVAPEILSYEPISLSTDIWSVGVLTYVLLSGYSPFAGENKQETYLNISQCALSFPHELFQDVSQLAQDFIRSTLVIDPRKRPTVNDLLQHPWLHPSDPIKSLTSTTNKNKVTIVSTKTASSPTHRVTVLTPDAKRKNYPQNYPKHDSETERCPNATKETRRLATKQRCLSTGRELKASKNPSPSRRLTGDVRDIKQVKSATNRSLSPRAQPLSTRTTNARVPSPKNDMNGRLLVKSCESRLATFSSVSSNKNIRAQQDKPLAYNSKAIKPPFTSSSSPQKVQVYVTSPSCISSNTNRSACLSCSQCDVSCCHVNNARRVNNKPVIALDRGIIC